MVECRSPFTNGRMHATIAPAHVCAAVSILRKEPQLSPDITLSIALDVLAAWHKPLLDSDSWSLFCQRLLRHVYDLTAPDPAVLNHAKPGSNTVYGELEPKTVSRLAAEAQITAESTFVDLGSGIGNVVLQVALEAGCRCYGWEVVPERAAVAQCMLRHFTALVDFFGLRVGEVCLIHGSFLDSAATWLHCTHIFSNNLKFTPELLDNIKTLLQTCPEGTQLITTKTLSGVERKGRVVRVNERTSWDIGAILVTRSLVGTWDSVSWTPTPVEFFLSTVDRKALDPKSLKTTPSGNRFRRTSRQSSDGIVYPMIPQLLKVSSVACWPKTASSLAHKRPWRQHTACARLCGPLSPGTVEMEKAVSCSDAHTASAMTCTKPSVSSTVSVLFLWC